MLAMGSREMPTKNAVMLIPERSGSVSESSPPKPLADPKLAEDKFWSWNSLAKKAKAVLLDDDICSRIPEARKAAPEPRSQKGEQVEVEEKCQKEPPVLQKGLGVIASSLCLISDTVGLAIEEGLNIFEYSNLEKEKMQPGLSKDLQLKASRDIAIAMASKAKMLLQELKTVKGDLILLGNRCSQLEEENKRLRESMVKGVRPEEDDLVRIQLETLLKEKSRLQQENAQYARENQFLHEVVEYHQVALSRLSSEAGEQSMEAQDVEFFDWQPTIAGASHACETERLCTKTNSLASCVS